MYIFRVVLLLLRQRRGAADSGLGTTIKYLRRTTSGAAGSGLGTTIKYLRRPAGNGLSTTVKYLRRATKQWPGRSDKNTCETQRAAPWATAWAPRSSPL